jgi:DNA-directed RNA polymerase specialized sigma24 family protein
MYSTRQPNGWQDPPQRKQHSLSVPQNPRQTAEALFRTRHKTPPVPQDVPTPVEIRSWLQLPQPRLIAAPVSVALAPAEPTLSPKQKRHMRTLYLCGLSAREAAEHFGVSLKTIDAALGKFTRKR